jgi:hypothetical protein
MRTVQTALRLFINAAEVLVLQGVEAGWVDFRMRQSGE